MGVAENLLKKMLFVFFFLVGYRGRGTYGIESTTAGYIGECEGEENIGGLGTNGGKVNGGERNQR